MTTRIKLFISTITVSVLLFCGLCIGSRMEKSNNFNSLEGIKTIIQFSPEAISTTTKKLIEQTRAQIDAIIAIPDSKRTFDNTLHALSDVSSLSDLAIFAHMCVLLKEVSPDGAIRAAAEQALIAMQDFEVDVISKNKKLFQSVKAYHDGNAQKETLRPDQRYFLDEVYSGYMRSGLELSDEKLEEVKKLNKELGKLSLQFSGHIAADASSVTVPCADLAGCDEQFIAALKKTDDGNCVLGVDYPTYFNVMENCTVSGTRKKLYLAFQNRAYPHNHEVLQEIIKKRDELARALGYTSYAHLDLEDEMVKHPDRAYAFLADLHARAVKKEHAEWNKLLPECKGIEQTRDGKLYPWDVMFASSQFKKKNYNLDDREVAEYFPADSTIKGLFFIYESFFSIKFTELPAKGFWHDDVQLITVASKDDPDHILGYLLLDLYPRPNKYSHAACFPIVPGQLAEGHKPSTTIAGVVANFPRSTGDKPALMMLKDVKTFFHEFGHALHHVLGATPIAAQAGTSVKRDFVELPSQMLEEWLDSKEILKLISKHYKTGEPLPDEMIDTLIELRNFGTGSFVTRQVCLSLLSLNCFGPNPQKNPHELWCDIANDYSSGFVHFEPDAHMVASFGHLTGYGAKYYGYLWSKVFALDLFSEIKKHGLLNPEIGRKYVREVLSKGGSQDPNELLCNFLGREPNSKAFFKAMGI
jgi:thimet oligopeptidase